jgi:GntR family transcriptional regulator, rspAB operon transcriptional repressor
MDIMSTLTPFAERLEGMEQHRLPQRAYHTVRLAIRNLVLPPGQAILEREISEALEMSRTPVREALVRLETEGMLTLVPRRGFIVAPIEAEDLREIYAIIGTLDGLAIELAAERAEEDLLGRLDSIIDSQEEALRSGDLTKWSALDDEFHDRIVRCAGNQRLTGIIDSYADQSYRARLYTIGERPVPTRSIIEHRAIVAAMRAKDGKAARMLMESHRSRAQREILEVLQQHEHINE